MTSFLRPASFLSLIALVGCQSSPDSSKSKSTPETVPIVAVAKVETRDLGSDFDVVAEFRPYQEADLYAKVAGYLSKLNVDLGDTVRQGQVLATLEVPELKQELEHAEHTEKRVQFEMGRARGDVDRMESMMKIREITFDRIRSISEKRPNLVAKQEIDDAQARFDESRGQVSAARANLAAAEQQIQVARSSSARLNTMIQYLQITAPFSGVVTNRYVFPGALIQAGTASATQAKPVVRISQINRLRLVAPVPESLISKLRIGQPLEIRVDTLKRIFQGNVSRFSDSVSNVTRTMETEIDLNNPGLVLKPGMIAHVSIPVERRPKAIAVPLQAVLEREGKSQVYVVTPEGTIATKIVQRGLETAEYVEILAGLSSGELAVLAGHSQLKQGQPAKAKLSEGAR